MMLGHKVNTNSKQNLVDQPTIDEYGWWSGHKVSFPYLGYSGVGWLTKQEKSRVSSAEVDDHHFRWRAWCEDGLGLEEHVGNLQDLGDNTE